MPLGRALGGEHADRPQPPLGEDGEAAHAHERDEQHAEDGRGDRDRLRVDHVGGLQRLGVGDAQASPGLDGLRRLTLGVEQHGDGAGVRDLTWHDQGELVEQALRVLDDAGHRIGLAVDGPGLAGAQVEVGRDAAGHGDLVRGGRVAAADEAEHRSAERAMRILCPQVERALGAGDRNGFVLDDVGRAVQAVNLGDPGADRRGRAGDRRGVLRGTEGSRDRGLGVGRDGRGDHGGADRGGDQREDEKLLLPLPAQQPQRPPDHGATGGQSAVARADGGGPFFKRGTHFPGSRESRDSGPAAGAVWSATRPSRRNTTRSAQAASCAS
jgi:hypothetical protein